MNDDFAPFELAVKLKEKGFREKCFATFDNNGVFSLNYEDAHSNIDLKDLLYSHNSSASNIWVDAPTISQVLKWLREEKKLHIEIYMYHNCYLWEIYNTKIYDADFTQKSEKYSEIEYETYEQAAVAGVKYCLENLI